MRRRLGRGWHIPALAFVAALGALALCACAGLIGIAPDDQIVFSDGSTESMADVPVEAFADMGTTDAPSADGSDAGIAEASTEGGPDAPADQATEAGTWCQQQPAHFFCSDFDEGMTDASSGWSGTFLSGATLAIDTTFARSPPASLVASSPSLPSGSSSHAWLEQDFTMAPTSVLDIALDLYMDALDDGGMNVATEAVGIQFGPPPNAYNLQLNVAADQTTLAEQQGSNYVTHPLTPALSPGKWTRVDIRLTLSGGPAVTVIVDGAVALPQTTLIPQFSNGAVTLFVGVVYTRGASSGTQVHVDDVTVDFPDGG